MLVTLLRRLAHTSRHTTKRISPAQFRDIEDSPITKSSVSNHIDKKEEASLFPAFESLNVATNDRVHSFSVPCDRVIKFIKLGAVNKAIATQYCHYIAHLSRSSSSPDAEYYSKRCIDLTIYIVRSNKELTAQTKVRLLCDAADTCPDGCLKICESILEQDYLKDFLMLDFARLMSSCYKFGLWSTAQSIVDSNEVYRTVNLRTIDALVEGIKAAAVIYKNSDIEKREQLRRDVIKHLLQVLEKSYKDRVQFATKYPKEFIKSLEDLNIKVQVNPLIKTTGRCTCCNSHLPLFDSRYVSRINTAVRELILKGSEKGLYLNASPNDSGRFESFLQGIHDIDKKPIDCVIDGLNIAYRNSAGVYFVKQQLTEDVQRTMKRRDPEGLVQVLVNVIIRGNFIGQFKKIVVVGKWHMTKWPGLMDFFKKNNIHFYSSFNNSSDDLYQIFASTLSPKTLLVTGDFFRDHLAQLKPDDRSLLERWIDTRQIWISSRGLKPIMPTPYEKVPSVQRDTGCFHVPIIDKNLVVSAHDLEPPPHLNKRMLTWICCQTG